MTRRILMAAVLALAVSGCSSPTPYQPSWMGDGYGYSEQRIEDNRYRISFAGNAATGYEAVRNYLLYRAAELTLAQGGDYFVVTERSFAADYGGRPSTSIGTGVGIGSGGRMSTGWSLGVGVPVGGTSGPSEAVAEIVIYRGQKPADTSSAFDAHEVRESLHPQILRPGE